MWVEIGIGVGTATTVLGLVGLIVRNQNNRIEKRVSEDKCEERHKSIERDLSRGEEQFSHIQQALDMMGQMMARMDERVKFLARKNGMKEDG